MLRAGYAVLFLVFVVLGIYYPSIFSGANSVDDVNMITAFLNMDHIDWKVIFFPGGSGYYYRPLLITTFALDNYLWGMQEAFLHLENILFHALNVVLVYFITLKVSQRACDGSRIVPLCAALLFAVHPVNTESVNWISGRTDLVAGSFILLTIFFCLCSLQSDKIGWGVAAGAAFLLGCLTKEVAVTALPALMFLVVFSDRWTERVRVRLICLCSLAVTGAAYFLFRYLAFKHGDTGIAKVVSAASGPSFTSLDTGRGILKASGFYLKKLFLPWPLNFGIVQISDYYVILGVVLVVICGYLLYQRSLIASLFLVSVSVAAPALLVALTRMAWTPLAERYLYIPCAMFCVGMVIAAYRFVMLNSPRAATKGMQVAIPPLLLTCAFTTVNRNITWQSNITLFQDTVRKSPTFFLAKNELALALQQGGKNDEAKAMLESVVSTNSKRGGKLIDMNKAGIMATGGDLVGAKKLLLRNLSDAGVYYPKIVERIVAIDMQLLKDSDDKQKAQELRSEIVALMTKLYENSGDPFYSYRLGQIYLDFGNKPEARRFFAKAYALSPDGTHYKLAAQKLVDKLAR